MKFKQMSISKQELNFKTRVPVFKNNDQHVKLNIICSSDGLNLVSQYSTDSRVDFRDGSYSLGLESQTWRSASSQPEFAQDPDTVSELNGGVDEMFTVSTLTSSYNEHIVRCQRLFNLF